MKSQNRVSKLNPNRGIKHGLDTSVKSIYGNSNVSEKFSEMNDLKAFNDYAIEGFIDYSMRTKIKK